MLYKHLFFKFKLLFFFSVLTIMSKKSFSMIKRDKTNEKTQQDK